MNFIQLTSASPYIFECVGWHGKDICTFFIYDTAEFNKTYLLKPEVLFEMPIYHWKDLDLVL